MPLRVGDTRVVVPLVGIAHIQERFGAVFLDERQQYVQRRLARFQTRAACVLQHHIIERLVIQRAAQRPAALVRFVGEFAQVRAAESAVGNRNVYARRAGRAP